MKLPVFPDKVQSFGLDFDNEIEVGQGVKRIIVYDLNGRGEVRFLYTRNWYWDFHIAVDDLRGATK